MILRKTTRPCDQFCGRCLKLQKVEVAVVSFELFRGVVALCAGCAKIVEEDGGEIKGCNVSGYPLDPTHPCYLS
jgi:hypothetical protein